MKYIEFYNQYSRRLDLKLNQIKHSGQKGTVLYAFKYNGHARDYAWPLEQPVVQHLLDHLKAGFFEELDNLTKNYQQPGKNWLSLSVAAEAKKLFLTMYKEQLGFEWQTAGPAFVPQKFKPR